MGNDLERQALKSIVDKLTEVGVELPPDLARPVQAVICGGGSTGARLWARAHPDDDVICCQGSLEDGAEGCMCWRPVYNVEQGEPRPPASAADLRARTRMCGDCAYKPDSKERTDPLMADHLMALPAEGQAFWCHDGMRRPVRWEHPDGRVVDGSPDDWDPPIIAGVPFQADGSPALLCYGWATRAARARLGSFTCPRCGRTSHHPDDARYGYCGACHDFTGEPG